MIRTPLSTVIGGAFWTPRATIVGGTSKTFNQIIQSLFANSEQGFVYDPNDLSTLYQDAAGTVPVTGVGQPVGLMLDKSKGMVLSGDKKNVGNTFLVGSAPAAAYDKITGVGTVSRADFSNQSYVLFSGLGVRLYQLMLKNTGLNTISMRSGSNSGSTVLFRVEAGKSVLFYMPASADAITLTSDAGTATFTLEFIKEIYGNHAYQTTSSMRPLLGASPQRLDFDTVDDKLITNLPAQLTGCTVIRSVPSVGTQILTGQTITTSYNDSTDHCGLIVINRALTPAETSAITAEFNKRAGV